MVDIKTEWNEQNLKEYVKYTVFSKNKTTKIALISFAVCCALILVFCLTVFFALGYAFVLIFVLTIILIAAVYVLFFAFTVKNCTKSILKANSDTELNRVMISDEDIIGFNDDEPIGTISWDKMADIYFSEKLQTAYLTTKGNSVLILECKNIVSGTTQELKEIVGAKRDKLSEKA